MTLRVVLIGATLAACCVQLHDAFASTATVPDVATVQQRVNSVSTPFVPNEGQWDSQVAFGARLLAGTMFVTTDGRLVYSLPGRSVGPRADGVQGLGSKQRAVRRRAVERSPGWVLTETFAGGDTSAGVRPHGVDLSPVSLGLFLGNDQHRQMGDLRTYSQIGLGEVFAEVDVQLRATGSNIEKIFTVAPHGDPARIQLRLEGATSLEIGEHGELIVGTGNGPVVYTAPVAYQESGLGGRELVDVRYRLSDDTNRTGVHRYGFVLAEYDHSRPLVIDPLLQSTYLGAAGRDVVGSIAIHPVSGDVYVAGFTDASTNTFPGVAGGARPTSGGDEDGFISHFNAGLTTLIKSTYIGGPAYDEIYDLAIHPLTGDIYVTGITQSLGSTFPGVTGGAQSSFGGGFSDAFVTRLSADLGTIVKSSYLGGAGDEIGYALAIHPVTGDIYVAGETTSQSNTFPAVAGGARSSLGGSKDAFISHFSADLTTLLKSTYLGAAGTDTAYAVIVHPTSGEVYAAGSTTSQTNTFSGVAGGAQATFGGTTDGFVSRLSADMTTLIKSTYLGTTGASEAFNLAVDSAGGDIYVSGHTTSSVFPGVNGGAQSATGGQDDAFVSRLSPDLTTVIRSTYLGGPGNDTALGLAIHPLTGEVYLTGTTTSTGNAFPGVTGGAQSINGGGSDEGFVSRFSGDLATLIKSTFIGSATDDDSLGIAIHPSSGDVYIVGYTSAAGSSFPAVAGGARSTSAGGVDGFVSRVTADLASTVITPAPFTFAAQNNVPTSSVRTSTPVQITGLGGSANAYVEGQVGSTFCVSSTNACTCDVSGAFVTTGSVSNTQYVCVREIAPRALNRIGSTTLHIGGQASAFVVSTGNLLGGGCSLDVDGNNVIDALTDGLIIIRAMFGLTGTAVTSAAVGPGASRSTWGLIRAYLNGNCGSNFGP